MKKKKRSITLIEIIIVMILIASITGALAYNYKKSLDQGRKFRAEQAISRIQTALDMEVAEGNPIQDVVTQWQAVIQKSPLINNPKDYFKDPWGEEYRVTHENDAIQVHSPGLDAYNQKK